MCNGNSGVTGGGQGAPRDFPSGNFGDLAGKTRQEKSKNGNIVENEEKWEEMNK